MNGTTIRTVNGTTFTTTRATSTVRVKDTEPLRADEIRTLCRQLSRKTGAEYISHSFGNLMYFSVDGVGSTMMREDALVAELRKQLHTAMRGAA